MRSNPAYVARNQQFFHTPSVQYYSAAVVDSSYGELPPPQSAMSNYHRNRIAAANTSIDELEKGPTYYSSPTPTQSTVTNGYLDRRRIRGRYNIEDWVLFVILFLMFLAILAILAIFIAVIVKVVQLSNAAERLIGTDSPLGSFISRLLSGST